MIGVLKIKPDSTLDAGKIMVLCRDQKYAAKKCPDGSIDIDYEESGISRSDLVAELRKVSRFEYGMSAVAEKLSFLEELLALRSKTLESQVNEAIASTGILLEQKVVGEFRDSNKNVFAINDHMDSKFVGKIAKALGVHDGGNPKKIAPDCYAAYIHGDALTFYRDLDDYKADFDE